MAQAQTKAKAPSEIKLDIKRVFKAPRAKVYQAWTDPKALAKWWGPEGMVPIIESFEAKIGRTYRTGMRAADGTTYWVSGAFTEVVPNERIVFTWAWENDGVRGHETRVTVWFADAGADTSVHLRHELFESVESRDQHNQGWTSSLGCLDAALTGKSKA